MAENNRGKDPAGRGTANPAAPLSTTAEVLESLLREQKKVVDDDQLTNPELDQLIGSLTAVPVSADATTPLTLEQLAAQTSAVSLAEAPCAVVHDGNFACKHCGFINPGTVRFCGSCGAKLKKKRLAESSAVPERSRPESNPEPLPPVLAADALGRQPSRAWLYTLLLVALAGLGSAGYDRWPAARLLVNHWTSELRARLTPPEPPTAVVNLPSAPAEDRGPVASAGSAKPDSPAAPAPAMTKTVPSKSPKNTRSSAVVRKTLPRPSPLSLPVPATELPLPGAPDADSSARPMISQALAQAQLLHKVDPEYPVVARMARAQGSVILHAVIGKDGSIQELRAAGGNPLLIPPAINAVKQWRYRPYVQDGEPVEVETTITVKFNGD